MFSHLPKHNRIAVAAIALAAVVASVWQLAMSATDSAQLNLLGSVAASVDVTVAGTVEAGVLNLSANHTEAALKVADVTEMANTPAGYTVTVTSANLAAGARCVGAQPCLWNSAGSYAIPFSLLKGGATKSFSGSITTWSDTNAAQLAPLQSAANIAYTVGGGILPQGAYAESLTFTITSK